MKNKLLLLLSLIYIPIIATSQHLEQKFQQKLDSIFNENKDAVGVIIHIEFPDKNISWTAAAGFSNKETPAPLQKNQPVLLASNTKTYVAASILRLVEKAQISLEQPINKLLTKKVKKILKKAGYKLKQITVKHLLSHTSGIHDYVDDDYFKFVNDHPQHQWSRLAQIKLTAKKRKSELKPGEKFSYGDINYILLTEIIEKITKKPFYIAMRELLKFKALNLNHTWFKNLEPTPSQTLKMAHQYANIYQWDSYDINPSWDLYGGGGIAATAKDAALFYQYLFEGKIIKNKDLLKEMTTYVLPKEESKYCLGLYHFNFGCDLFYHGGWWGTDIAYSPQANASVAMFTLEKGSRGTFAVFSKNLLESLAKQMIDEEKQLKSGIE